MSLPLSKGFLYCGIPSPNTTLTSPAEDTMMCMTYIILTLHRTGLYPKNETMADHTIYRLSERCPPLNAASMYTLDAHTYIITPGNKIIPMMHNKNDPPSYNF